MRTRRKGFRLRLGWMVPAAAAVIGGLLWMEQPLDEMLVLRIRQQAVETVNAAVYDAAEELLVQTDLAGTVEIRRDEAGRIVSLETDGAALASMQASLNRSVQKKLAAKAPDPLRVPVGTLLGWSLLRERGPAVTVHFALEPAVQCTLTGQFSEAGVNQTLHELWLEAEGTVYAMLPGHTAAETVTVRFCMAQTVIVGEVPAINV